MKRRKSSVSFNWDLVTFTMNYVELFNEQEINELVEATSNGKNIRKRVEKLAHTVKHEAFYKHIIKSKIRHMRGKAGILESITAAIYSVVWNLDL